MTPAIVRPAGRSPRGWCPPCLATSVRDVLTLDTLIRSLPATDPGRGIFRVTTSEPMICAIVWGEDESFGRFNNSLSMNGTGIKQHDVVLPDVAAGVEYRYIVQGTTADGTIYRSDIGSFRIDPATSSTVVDRGGVEFVTRSMADGTARTETFTVTVDDGAVLGPFPTGTVAEPQLADIEATGHLLRFDIEASTDGNVGAVEIQIFGPKPGQRAGRRSRDPITQFLPTSSREIAADGQ